MKCRMSRLGLIGALGAAVLFAPAARAEDEAEAPARPRKITRTREDEQRPRRPAGRRQGAPRAAPARERRPRPTVIRFEHISAASYVHTLKQLGRNPHIAQALRELPLALNEEANAVVVIAPDEVTQMLTAIARGLDRPSEYRQRRQAERRGRWARRGAMPPPAAPRPMRRREGKPPASLGRLLSRDAVARLRLTPEQVEKIEAVLARARAAAPEARERTRRPQRDGAPPGKARREMAERHKRIEARLDDVRRRVHKEVFSILTPEQREMAERLLDRGHADRPQPPPRPAPMRGPADRRREPEPRE
jgi:Spy/CpxP family protein refolding chaperone